ncbi:MAG: hypothetical protein MI724_05055 [Spirochaetales bacterium]|nr:hypothetical protein [Spirochaetales bacterium]
MLVIVDLMSLAESGVEVLGGLPDSVAVMVVAPRRNIETTARLAGELSPLPISTPRVFLDIGESREWRVSVPGEVTPAWFARAIATSREVPIDLAQLNAARLGFGLEDAVLRAALNAGMPAARLELLDMSDLTAAIEPLDAYLEASREAGAPRREDSNHLIIPGSPPVVVSERVLIWSIVATATLLLSYAVVRPRRAKRYLRAIGHNITPIIGIYIVLVLSLIAGNGGLRLLARIDADVAPPLLQAGAKIAASFLTLGLLYPLLHIRLRRASTVYSGASLLFLLLGSVISGTVSIITSAFLFLAFLFGFFFSLAHNAWLKSIALLAALLPSAYLLIALAAVADPAMAESLFRPPLWREIVTAVLFLPLLLMFFRIEALTPRLPLLTITVSIAATALAIIVATIIMRLREPEPIRISVVERYRITGPTVPDAGEIVIEGSGSVPDDGFAVAREGRAFIECARIPCRRSLAAPRPPMTLQVDRTDALGRHRLSWTIQFDRPADKVDVVLEADRPIQLYASDIVAEEEVGSTDTRFVLLPGPLPPAEIGGTVVLRVPDDSPPVVTITASADFSLTTELSPPEAEGDAETVVVPPRENYRIEWTLQERLTLQ